VAGRLLTGATLVASAIFLTTGCGGGGGGKPRPDLLFVSTRDGDYAIFAMNADGSHETRLSRGKGDPSTSSGLFYQVDPAWSPDGRSIAFDSRRDGHSHIYVMRADGTATRRLTDSLNDDDHPTWSPDGRRILFARQGALFVVPAGGGPARRVGHGLGSAADPAWSPDGSLIAYDYRQPGYSSKEIYVMRADGSGIRRLTSFQASSIWPSWSPDGKRIAFSSDARGGQIAIYSIGTSGIGLRLVSSSTTDEIQPAWSPDGKEIAFSRDGAIVVAPAGAGSEKTLTETKNNDSGPAWKPLPRSQH
jgi:Tol biopolymer transport system component